LKYNYDMFTTKAKLGNESLYYEVGVKPKDLKTDDMALAGKHSLKYEPVKGKFETTNGVKYGSPRVGPLRFWPTVSLMFLSL
jgi:hypothetical protein